MNELSELSKQFQTFFIHETGYTSSDSKQLIENIQDLIAEILSEKNDPQVGIHSIHPFISKIFTWTPWVLCHSKRGLTTPLDQDILSKNPT